MMRDKLIAIISDVARDNGLDPTQVLMRYGKLHPIPDDVCPVCGQEPPPPHVDADAPPDPAPVPWYATDRYDKDLE